MKAPKPQAPIDLPPCTVQVSGPIEWFLISIGVKGDDLVPEEVTAVLRREPDSAQKKGKPLYRSDGSLLRVPKFGAWWAKLARKDTHLAEVKGYKSGMVALCYEVRMR
jgi:hypothetical protein